MTESAGVGAHINFARLEVFRATGELEERREIGAGKIISGGRRVADDGHHRGSYRNRAASKLTGARGLNRSPYVESGKKKEASSGDTIWR